MEATLGSEMRTGKRFPLTLPIHLKDSKAGKMEKATTENVSGAGVYVHSSAKLAAGTSIEFDITFPAAIAGHEDRRCHPLQRPRSPGG